MRGREARFRSPRLSPSASVHREFDIFFFFFPLSLLFIYNLINKNKWKFVIYIVSISRYREELDRFFFSFIFRIDGKSLVDG